MEGDNAHEYAQRMQFTDKLILTKTYEEAFRLLSFGRHDAVLAQSLVGEMMIANLGLKTSRPSLSLVRTISTIVRNLLQFSRMENLPQIRCRSQQIQQVLMNLLTNARDALNKKYPGYHEDKKMCIHCATIDRQGVQWLRIMVEDHGDGIPQDIRDKIYNPFFTTKDRSEGTGLGLSISFGIIRDHQGELSFETEPGLLTRFFIDLPAAELPNDAS